MSFTDLTIRVADNDLSENDSYLIFKQSLPSNRYQEMKADGKYIGYDGLIHILDSKGGATGQNFLYQLKSTSNPKLNSYPCSKKYLNLWRVSTPPVILIFVNLSSKTVYWEHMSQFYIDQVLGFANINKQKTIKFKSTKTIKEDGNFLDSCCQICQDHAKLLSEQEKFENEKAQGVIPLQEVDPLTADSENQLDTALDNLLSDKRQLAAAIPPPQETASQQGELEKIKQKFLQSLSSGLSDKFGYYQGFIYLLEPFYIDVRGQEVRAKLRELLSVSAADENLILQELLKHQLVKQVGGILFATDKEQTKKIVNEVLDSNDLDISQLLTIFL